MRLMKGCTSFAIAGLTSAPNQVRPKCIRLLSSCASKLAPVIAIIGRVAYMLEQISAPLFYELKLPIQRTAPQRAGNYPARAH
jgi:hypothetical protein